MSLGMDVGQRIGDEEEQLRRMMENAGANTRVAMPGEIVDFDAEKQTATVQPLIKEKVQGEWEQLPQLLDVPVFFPRAGGYCLTFPVKEGDECLIIFNDMCLDAWWQSGGIQNQLEMRRHDLSDAMALLGITSVPKAVTDYSEDSMQLRNEEQDAYFEITDEKIINIKSVEDINVETEKDINIKAAQNITITAESAINIKSIGAMSIESDTSITMTAPRIDINK